ncbi:DUF1690-domain-containing protein [Durotheca rogersii]|uniref:DUF1690-domain-containing protein n=1 Tax=Durotheca rogersii TaxID=419775 RepID=UPI0022202A1D|nr:DUF1690-domain-containing protein [Durotheca rogersii]KAI5860759.1 DUF1690-domain-containing protein [Durotheca rogersii]
MGTSASKPASGESPSHVWKAPSSIGLSHDVAESLNSSSETDTSRAQTLELLVQARVADELRRLSEHESALLRAAHDKIASNADADDGAATPADGSSPSHPQHRQTVSKEVEALRARLDKRKQLRPLPESVERARSDVVRCLVDNDRRPLDCWREVEAFKEEVRRLEKSWVDRVVS